MKKFSTIGKTDLQDNEPKTFNETLKALVEDVLSIKISGEQAELAGNLDVKIDGKDKLVSIIEKLTNVHILKERIKVLESAKLMAVKHQNLNWIDNEITTINETISKYIAGELNENIKIITESNIITEGKKCEWTSKYFEDNEKDCDEFLKSFQYFVDTYENGQRGQLKTMLKSIIKDKKVSALKSYLNDDMVGEKLGKEIKEYILDQMDED